MQKPFHKKRDACASSLSGPAADDAKHLRHWNAHLCSESTMLVIQTTHRKAPQTNGKDGIGVYSGIHTLKDFY